MLRQQPDEHQIAKAVPHVVRLPLLQGTSGELGEGHDRGESVAEALHAPVALEGRKTDHRLRRRQDVAAVGGGPAVPDRARRSDAPGEDPLQRRRGTARRVRERPAGRPHKLPGHSIVYYIILYYIIVCYIML